MSIALDSAIAQSEVWSQRNTQRIAESRWKNDFTFWLIFGLSPDLGLSKTLGKRLIQKVKRSSALLLSVRSCSERTRSNGCNFRSQLADQTAAECCCSGRRFTVVVSFISTTATLRYVITVPHLYLAASEMWCWSGATGISASSRKEAARCFVSVSS